MSITVERRTRSTVRTEYSVSLWAKRENRPRLIIGAPRDSAAPFRTERREIISVGLVSLSQPGSIGQKTKTLWDIVEGSCVTIRGDTKPDASSDPEGKPFGTNLRAWGS